MTKPDWKDAPEWAKWWAQDKDGSCWWFASKPKCDDGMLVGWYAPDLIFEQDQIAHANEDWRDSLESRP